MAGTFTRTPKGTVSDKTGALTEVTNRDWACCLTTWADNQRRDFTVVNYDWEYMEDICDAADVDTAKAVFHRDTLRGRMELYEVDLPANGTLLAHWVDDDTTDWITEE